VTKNKHEQSGRIVVVPADIQSGHMSNKRYNTRASLVNQNDKKKKKISYKPKGKSDNTKDERHKLI
jgi:hypothetical protein